MKIKRLELCGFKSFVDRTVVNFEHDVMGIVGPNGCGKSNIVDSIRWCMGEQSAKHLRGRSMDDVIFSGSESRPGAEMAEVTLTFENNDPTDVPLEYKDYAEIAVTRRLHRTGDSEYLINKTPVRLRDVTDLFLGTGIGTKAYSIVEQGKIGLIVSAKPEDRRMLIEEAAGITKFKARKKQAEKKMEMTQQNLLRVGDIVAEIERNLGSLKRQAAKAERYVTYKQELEDLQLYEASHKWLEHTGWMQLESSEVERLTLEADAAKTELVTREASLETLRLDAFAAEQRTEQASNENFAAENDVRSEEALIARAQDRIQTLRDRAEQAAIEQAGISQKNAELSAEAELLDGEVLAFQAEDDAFGGELAIEEAVLAERAHETEAAGLVVNEHRGELSRAQAEVASSEAKLSGFERRREETANRKDRLEGDREVTETKIGELEHRHEELVMLIADLREGKVSSDEERDQLSLTLEQLRANVMDSERALEEAKERLQKRRSRLSALSEIVRRLTGVGVGAKTLVEGGNPAVKGLVADRMDVPEELTQAVAGLLGSRLSEVLVDDTEAGLVLLTDLATGKKGRATVVPSRPRHIAGTRFDVPMDVDGCMGMLRDLVKTSVEDEPLVATMLGDAILARDEEAARKIAQFTHVPVVTLSGTVFHEDGRISGGTGEEVAASMLEHKREIRELEEGVRADDTLVTERLGQYQTLRDQIQEAHLALERARQRAHSDELSLVQSETQLTATAKELDQRKAHLAQVQADVAAAEHALAEADAEKEAALALAEDARGRAEERTTQLALAEAALAEARQKTEAQREVVMSRKVNVAKSREKLQAAKGTLVRLEKSREELTERHQRLEDELCRGAAEMGEAIGIIVTHKEKLHGALDRARTAADALAEVRSIFDAHRSELGEHEGAMKDIRSRADTAKEDLTTHEMALRERTLAREHLLESVAEKFRGLILPRVIGDYHMRPPPGDEEKTRIHELTGLLDRMGSVNLEAMREHEEAEKRYTFYTEQKGDLDRALLDLERAIQQMNRESKKLFQETFDAVNARFQEIFPRMFRGGAARLRLTDPEDMLETGIDILAQPPGKKLSSIELMSGGEKALTAVSLIFAIFQIKPSPFCILDEVDAPLDEANVARYNEMIRSMTDSSQFILITHIKRTMQMVDVLHGVTMQESGVSRLVSVKMHEADEKAKKSVIDSVAVA
jgi:chromosome segregation protein